MIIFLFLFEFFFIDFVSFGVRFDEVVSYLVDMIFFFFYIRGIYVKFVV